jgi:acetoacetyl-CoA synthetase
LYQFSVDNRTAFWTEVFGFVDPIYSGSYTRVVDESLPIDSIPRWFEGLNLNWAENLLWSRTSRDPPGYHGTVGKKDGKIAVTEVREGAPAGETREYSWAVLRKMSAEYAAALHAQGVRRGDRVVAVAANSMNTLVVMIATSWIGAVFSSSSTDMGVQGILQRTVQVNPRVCAPCGSWDVWQLTKLSTFS